MVNALRAAGRHDRAGPGRAGARLQYDAQAFSRLLPDSAAVGPNGQACPGLFVRPIQRALYRIGRHQPGPGFDTRLAPHD